jgi:polyisoprenoid-binding protein YceI
MNQSSQAADQRPCPAATGRHARWRLDPSASSAEFQVPHFWGLVTVKGHFEQLAGWLEVGDSQELQMTLTIDAASLDTGMSRRDKHLRSADFFDTQNHSEVRFRSTSVSNTREHRLRVEGELESRASAWRWHSNPPCSRATTSWTSRRRQPSISASWA